MKLWLGLVFAVVVPVGALVALGIRRHWVATHVTMDWLVDSERRSWSSGIDQACVRKWPISKIVNEAGWFNSQKLRKRA